MVQRALRRVFSHIGYIFAACVISIFIATVTLLWPNAQLLSILWRSETTAIVFKLDLTWQLLIGSFASMGTVPVLVIIVTAGLTGLVASMTWYAWRSTRAPREFRMSFAATGAGVVAALLGIGCIACGPLLVTSLLALVGGAGILLLLPLHGVEFGVIALLLLSFAIYTLAKVISAPAVCGDMLQ